MTAHVFQIMALMHIDKMKGKHMLRARARGGER